MIVKRGVRISMGKSSVFGIFSNPNYLRMFLANFTSQMGSVIGLTAFTFYLLDQFSNQPYYTAITEMMYSLPTLAVFFIVGVLADRMDRQKIAAYSDWISAILTIVFLISVNIEWLPLIFAILFLRSAVTKFFSPAEAALIQGILKKDEYTAAAGLNQMVQSIFMLFGFGLGLVCYRLAGLEGAIIIDAVSFVISGILIRSCKLSEEIRLPNGRSNWRDLHIGLVLREFIDGLFFILRNRLLFYLIIGFIIFGVVNGGFSVMFMYILKYKLDPLFYENSMVWVGIVFGVGILIGSLLSSVLAKRLKLYQMIIGGLLISGTLTIVCGVVNHIWIFFAVCFFMGLSIAPINVAIGGWMPQIVDAKIMGRVQSWINPLMMLAQSLTLGLIALSYPKFVKVEMLFYGIGLCLLIVACFYSITLPRMSNITNPSKVGNVSLTQEIVRES